MIFFLNVILIIGGTWVLYDSLASIGYYLGRADELWRFNHAVRIARAFWSLVFISIGVYYLMVGL